MKKLPAPECHLGYTWGQLDNILATDKENFNKWMYGQTMALCEEHGGIVYPWDLTRYLAGLPITD